MNRKRALAWAAVVLGVASGALAIWAKTTYDRVGTTQSFYYTLIGQSAAVAEVLGARDAAAATGGVATAAWIFLAAAILATLLAIAVKPDPQPSADAASV